MDIAALSTGLSQIGFAQEVSMSVMKMAMDSVEGQAVDITKMLAQSVNPHIGSKIDVSL